MAVLGCLPCTVPAAQSATARKPEAYPTRSRQPPAVASESATGP